jgi:hypothetical protein
MTATSLVATIAEPSLEQRHLDVENRQLGLQREARLDRLDAVVGGDRGMRSPMRAA